MRYVALFAMVALYAIPTGGAMGDLAASQRCLAEHANSCSHGPTCCGFFWCAQPVSPPNSCQQAVDQCWARVMYGCRR